MNHHTIVRATVVVAALAVAASSQAQLSLFVESGGSAALIGPAEVQFTEVVAGPQFESAPLTSFSTLSYTLSLITGSGSGTYTGVGGTLDFSYQLDGANLVLPASASFSGEWVSTGGTGSYAGKSGTGTLGLDVLGKSLSTAYSGTVFSGYLSPVPEPAPLAVMGIGICGFLIRRKRKA